MQLQLIDLDADATRLIASWMRDGEAHPDIKTALARALERRWPPSLLPVVEAALLAAARSSDGTHSVLEFTVGFTLGEILASDPDALLEHVNDDTLPERTRAPMQDAIDRRR